MSKNKKSIKELVHKAVCIIADRNGVPCTFYGFELIEQVRWMLSADHGRRAYDSTILRALRQLKEDGIIDYEMVSIPHSKYKLKWYKNRLES